MAKDAEFGHGRQNARMTKYDRLRDFLTECGREEIRLSLNEIEEILGEGLPGSAELCQWWHNPRSALSSQPRLPAWIAAGYEAEHPRGTDGVIFRRNAGDTRTIPPRIVSGPARAPHGHRAEDSQAAD
jgi:hypothetical protein